MFPNISFYLLNPIQFFVILLTLFVKADGIDNQQLMRVYGALMWSLGKVLTCPEVPRVFIGSWWDKQVPQSANQKRVSCT